jgi:hypothetical protein
VRPLVAAFVEVFQTAPQFDVHFREQVALPVCVEFIPADQAAHRLPVLNPSLHVKLILIVATQTGPLPQ